MRFRLRKDRSSSNALIFPRALATHSLDAGVDARLSGLNGTSRKPLGFISTFLDTFFHIFVAFIVKICYNYIQYFASPSSRRQRGQLNAAKPAERAIPMGELIKTSLHQPPMYSEMNGAECRKNPKNSSAPTLPLGDTSRAVFRPAGAPNDRGQRGSLDAANLAKRELINNGRALRQNWLDASNWRSLANQRGYRLPHWYLPLSATGIEKVLGALSLDRQFYRETFGLKTYQDYVDKNPTVPLWAFAGICLELSNRKA